MHVGPHLPHSFRQCVFIVLRCMYQVAHWGSSCPCFPSLLGNPGSIDVHELLYWFYLGLGDPNPETSCLHKNCLPAELSLQPSWAFCSLNSHSPSLWCPDGLPFLFGMQILQRCGCVTAESYRHGVISNEKCPHWQINPKGRELQKKGFG